VHPDFEFNKLPKGMFEDKALTRQNLDVLNSVGFPGFVSPHLYFGEFDDGELFPILSSWSWRGDWEGDIGSAITNFSKCCVIGSGQNGEPIVLMPNENTIYQISHDGSSLIYINSDLSKLYATLDAFIYMVDEAIKPDSEILNEKRVNPTLIDSFKAKLKKIDSVAYLQHTLWLKLANACSINFNASGL
jgi:hypothetical protein